MTDNAVEIAAIAGSAAVHDLSVWSLIAQADMVVKAVMFLLMASSVWCWAIIYDKWNYFQTVKNLTTRFDKAYRTSKVYTSLYDRIKKKSAEFTNNPMAMMFVAGMSEIKNGIISDVPRPTPDMINNFKDKVHFASHKVKADFLDKMEDKLIILATVGSAAPFIGLFGTVWGIVNSFQAIAATKNTTLAVVAPGIAEALLATAMGLFAAIPAVVFYNIFSNEIRKISVKLEDYGSEISSELVYNATEEE